MPATVVTAPNMWRQQPHQTGRLFLAGGITNCSDWQAKAVAKLEPVLNNVVIFNPRRENWNMGAQEAESRMQIIWEHRYLRKSNHILFWFPSETLCPITLFELGAALERDAGLTIGCDPDYKRLFDVREQVHLKKPDLHVFTDFDQMIEAEINSWVV